MRYILAILALAGVWVSALSLRIHYSTETSPCSINAKWDCDLVNHSPYSEIKGIPVAAMGIAGYFVLAALALMGQRLLVFLSSLIGLGYALYLAHIERDVLMVWCLYCVISLGVIALITLLSLLWMAVWGIRSKYELHSEEE
ncbi:MAG: vitamin K epoxide reductase family protein [Terracidiphilus sp.]